MSDLGSNMSPREFAERIIEEMEQADRVVIETKNALGEMDAHYVLAKDLAAAIRDLARPAPQPVGVKVKPLFWYDPPEGETYRIGRCGQIAYTVQFDFGRWGYRSNHTNGFVISRKGGVLFKDQADAMAGCDEDHERRIRAVLDPQPARTFTEDEALAMVALAYDHAWKMFSEKGPHANKGMITTFEAKDVHAALKRVTDAAEAKGRREALKKALAAVADAEETKCVRCGRPKSDHQLRHPFVADAPTDAQHVIRALIEKEGQPDD